MQRSGNPIQWVKYSFLVLGEQLKAEEAFNLGICAVSAVESACSRQIPLVSNFDNSAIHTVLYDCKQDCREDVTSKHFEFEVRRYSDLDPVRLSIPVSPTDHKFVVYRPPRNSNLSNKCWRFNARKGVHPSNFSFSSPHHLI